MADLSDTVYKQAIYSYQSKLPVYSIAFSTKKNNYLRLALGSLNNSAANSGNPPENRLEIIELRKDGSKLRRTSKIEQKIPPSKILFFPEHTSANPDLFITSSDTLKIWEILENGEIEIKSSLWNVSCLSL